MIDAKPDAILSFHGALREFNEEVSTNCQHLQSELRRLSTTWQDQEYVKFSAELDHELRGFLAYLQGAEQHINDLYVKSLALYRYLGR
jgi:uncharacterized protein YukE